MKKLTENKLTKIIKKINNEFENGKIFKEHLFEILSVVDKDRSSRSTTLKDETYIQLVNVMRVYLSHIEDSETPIQLHGAKLFFEKVLSQLSEYHDLNKGELK